MTLKFGTDGVRGVANRELTPELALTLGRAAARVFGIQHYGAKVQAAMEPGVETLLARGAARVEGERVVLAG